MTDEDTLYDADDYEFEDPNTREGDFELFKPAENEEGYSVVGRFTGTVDFGYGPVYVVDEFGSDQAVGFPSNAVLGGEDGEFASIEEDNVVKVEFLGMQQGEDESKDPYANYNVQIGKKKE